MSTVFPQPAWIAVFRRWATHCGRGQPTADPKDRPRLGASGSNDGSRMAKGRRESSANRRER